MPTDRRPPQPSRPPDAARARRVSGYSRLVWWAKIALPLAAILVIGLVFLSSREKGGIIDMRTVANTAALGVGLKLEDPRFTGITQAGEPFEITAVSALPDRPMPTRIDLTDPTGEIRLASGIAVNVTARSGAMLRSEDKLTLDGGIVITTSDGYTAETDSILVDLDTDTVTATSPVEGVGPAGSISARRMTLVRSNDGLDTVTVRFEGDVAVRFLPSMADRTDN